MLEQKGMTQTYIDKIKPIAVIISAYQAHCRSSSCTHQPKHKFEIDDSSGTSILNEGKLAWRGNLETSESIMGFMNPIPTGDLTIRMSVSQTAGGTDYADAYAALPDLRIGRKPE